MAKSMSDKEIREFRKNNPVEGVKSSRSFKENEDVNPKIRKRPQPMPKPSTHLSVNTWHILQVQRSIAYRNTVDNVIKRGSIK